MNIKKLFSFKGRLNRLKFVFYYSATLVILSFLDILANNVDTLLPLFIILFVDIIGYVFFIFKTIQRLHDINLPGITILIFVISQKAFFSTDYLFFLIIIILFLALISFVKGTNGPNKYGDDPIKGTNDSNKSDDDPIVSTPIKKEPLINENQRLIMMQLLFNSQGRINRAKYCVYHFLVNVVTIILLLMIIPFMDNALGVVLFYIIIIASFYPIICLTIKRVHDLDKSGYFVLLFLIPLVNLYPAILCICIKGTDGPNIYGEDPLAIACK